MSELLSVGLDVGTTSTQMIVSRLTVENRASAFAVPEMAITQREILYRSPVHFTPLLDDRHMDGDALRELVLKEYQDAGISRQAVDTGAILITGETSRKENAQTVLNALSDLAGDFVVAAAGPDLESVLAAKGAGAVEYSRKTGKTVLHMDIGGGTSNLALIRQGKIAATGCLNVGGRLLKFDQSGRKIYTSPVLEGIPYENEAELARILANTLEAAAGMGSAPWLQKLTTEGTAALPLNDPGEPVTLSFSGGVADCIEKDLPPRAFGDMGPLLGKAIRESRLCQGDYRLGDETIRATVIGAGCHSAMLSGSTVYCRNVPLPIKNIPVVHPETMEEAAIRQALSRQDGDAILAFPGIRSPSFSMVARLAETIAAGLDGHPAFLCLEADMAKALGQALAVRLGNGAPILCLDRIRVEEGSYLDVSNPVGPALPVVVKTLIFSKDGESHE